MKKLLTLSAIVLISFAIQAQNCQALFTATVDTNNVASFTDLSTSSTGNIIGWMWTFQGAIPSTSSSQNPTGITWNTNGIYIVCLEIYTDDSCSSTYCDSILIGNGINPCAGFYQTSQVTNCSGYGLADGSISLNVYGGTAPYTYLWNTSANTPVIQGLTSGVYCVTITDNAGCILTDCITVAEGNPCNINVTYNITDEMPAGAMNGAIDISVTGGMPPYYYYWSNGATTEDISGLAMGSYTVYISDSDSCSYTNTFYVWGDTLGPCQMYLSGTVTDVSTIGGNDGAIDLTVYGGSQPYSFYWNTGATTEDISGLTQGVYSVQVMDTQGCSNAMTFSVMEPSSPSQWDTLYAGVIDTCINFVYDSVFVYNFYMVDSNTISVTWAATGGGQIAYVTVEYAVYQSGYYWAVLSINCGTKSIETFMDGIYVDLNSVAGISNQESLSELVLYPNPVKNSLNMSIKTKADQLVNLQIFTITGQIIMNKSTYLTKGVNNLQFDVSNLKQGMYFIKIQDKTIKFLK